MYILGLSCFYHDASACLLEDGKIIAAAQEERFTRKKHDIGFPVNSAKWCLEHAGITINDVDYIAFYEKPFLKFERILHQHFEMFPKSFYTFYKAIPSWINEKLRVIRIIRKKLRYKGDVMFIKHHLAHAASSFLTSNFEKAAILTVDGVGEWETTTLGIGDKNNIDLIKVIDFPHSIGLLYSTVTAHLGFSVNNSEYKVMGLAPYGNPIYYENFKKIIDIREDGSYKLDMSYFDYNHKLRMPGKKFIKEFGPIRKPESEVTQKHKDIAASLQKITEEAILKMLNHLYKTTKCENLCMAGGVALNSVANGKILKNTPFKRIYIQPDPGDGGTSIGCALYVYNSILNKKREFILDNAYLGPGYSREEIKKFLDDNKIKYTELELKEIPKKIAELVYKNDVVGWFRGRMEWGPRALGSRSILSNPCNPGMKEILNLKVKHREKFRPFAPVIIEEKTKEYFEGDNPVPIPTDFMLMVYPIKKDKQKLIPAVTHVDGSGRLQTIRRKQNPLYYDTIVEFNKLTKVPVLINTSFNIRGEPIVCSPFDAYKCMMGTGIDYLIMENFFIKRQDNSEHMWDSEEIAKD